MDAVQRMLKLASDTRWAAWAAAHGGDGGSYCFSEYCRSCHNWRMYTYEMRRAVDYVLGPE